MTGHWDTAGFKITLSAGNFFFPPLGFSGGSPPLPPAAAVPPPLPPGTAATVEDL